MLTMNWLVMGALRFQIMIMNLIQQTGILLIQYIMVQLRNIYLNLLNPAPAVHQIVVLIPHLKVGHFGAV